MPNYQQYGTATRVTATGLQTITSADAAIIGVLMAGTGTSSLSIFHGITASASVCIVRGYVSVAVGGQPGLYFPVPMYCSGGITIDLNNDNDPNLTLFWNPVG